MLKFPSINLRSKNELVERISFFLCLTNEKTLNLVNYCKNHKNECWRDNNKMSDIKKNKHVRSANPQNLKKILNAIDKVLIKPYDNQILPFVWGGISKKSHISAAKSLMNGQKERYILRIDLKRFFEQIEREQVFGFFNGSGCSLKLANMLADFCCVQQGVKNSSNESICLARGFPTSTRIAVWCSHKFFLDINKLIQRELKNNNPRIAVFIDDIGISAINVSLEILEKIYKDIKKIAQKHGIELNNRKKKIFKPNDTQEFLGIRLFDKKIGIGKKTLGKKYYLQKKLKEYETDKIKKRLKSISIYERRVRSFNSK